MSLRKELEQRLSKAIEPWGDRLLDDDAWMGALAEECIRQMEWAYRRGSEPGVLAASFDEYDWDTLPTIAPPEWKP